MGRKRGDWSIGTAACGPPARHSNTLSSKTSNDVKRGDIVIYKLPQGPEIGVKLEKDIVWLDAHLIAKLFDVNRLAIIKHINNIDKTAELDKQTTCSILEQVAAGGKVRRMNLYNLDVIISVGYRVNSKQATHFRIWATKILKNYLISCYALNERRFLETQDKFKELQQTISFLEERSKHKILAGQGQKIGIF